MGNNVIGTTVSQRKLPFLRFALLLAAIALITFIEVNIPVFSRGLAGTPYILLVVVGAMWSDYVTGIVAIIASSIGLIYAIPPVGMHINGMKAFKLLEFLLAAGIICVLTWKWHATQRRNMDLVAATNKLQVSIKRMQTRRKGNKKQLAELSRINKDLEALVQKFLEDENYWQTQMEHAASELKLKRVLPAPGPEPMPAPAAEPLPSTLDQAQAPRKQIGH